MTVPGGPRGGDGVHHVVPRRCRESQLAQVHRRLAIGQQPARVERAAVEHVGGLDGARGLLAESHAAARDEVARPRQLHVPGNEFGMRDAVTVREDQVLGAGFFDGAIQDPALAKAIVLVPHVPDVEVPVASCAFDAFTSLLPGTVVGDHHFEAAIGLARVSGQHARKVVRAVVGGEHDSDGRDGALGLRMCVGGDHAADFASRLLQPCDRFVSVRKKCDEGDIPHSECPFVIAQRLAGRMVSTCALSNSSSTRFSRNGCVSFVSHSSSRFT